jgi:CheY-like chemotaxis protein
MPIVDGLTSTKMIRSHEKTTPSQKLSERAALNSRIPIIAVSASLVERERQTYIDAGFDAWILKPISFDRLQTLLAGIVDPKIREECLYKAGQWEQGGWFNLPHDSKFETQTKPDDTKASAGGIATADARAAINNPQDPDAVAEKGQVDLVQETLRRQQEADVANESVYVIDMAAPAKSNTAPAKLGGSMSESTPRNLITNDGVVDTPEPIEYPLGKPAT